MVNPLTQFVGHGASLLAVGRAARKARIAAGGDGGAREGTGAATADAWPLELLATRPAPPTSEEGWFPRVKMPSKEELREAGRQRAVESQAAAEAPDLKKRERAKAQAEEEARLLQPLAAADAPRGKRRRSAIAAAVRSSAISPGAPSASSSVAQHN